MALSAPHVGLSVDSLGRQIQLEVTTLIGKNNQGRSILNTWQSAISADQLPMLSVLYLFRKKQTTPHRVFCVVPLFADLLSRLISKLMGKSGSDDGMGSGGQLAICH